MAPSMHLPVAAPVTVMVATLALSVTQTGSAAPSFILSIISEMSDARFANVRRRPNNFFKFFFLLDLLAFLLALRAFLRAFLDFLLVGAESSVSSSSRGSWSSSSSMTARSSGSSGASERATLAETMVMCSSLQVAKMYSTEPSVASEVLNALAMLQPSSETPMEEPMKHADLTSTDLTEEMSPISTGDMSVTSSPSSAWVKYTLATVTAPAASPEAKAPATEPAVREASEHPGEVFERGIFLDLASPSVMKALPCSAVTLALTMLRSSPSHAAKRYVASSSVAAGFL